ncbi:MAG: hypothetical protein SGI77_05935 [Pirellulaceae bacterium]|nr:hypothetical protein [Pirellulaceae bacterium]
MGTRVEKLLAIDTELCHDDFEIVQRSLALLLDRVNAAEPNESKLTEQVAKIVEQALAFVIKARTQETAIATWFMEAFNRDRGVGD